VGKNVNTNTFKSRLKPIALTWEIILAEGEIRTAADVQ
jgi:hypothetical protein